MPLKPNLEKKYANNRGKQLPKRGSAVQAARIIKEETDDKTYGRPSSRKEQETRNRVARQQNYGEEKSQNRYTNTSRGKSSSDSWERTKSNFKNGMAKAGLYNSNPNANAFEDMHKSMYDGAIQTGNERRRAFANRTLREAQQDAFANTAGGRFLANTAESLIDNSVLAVPYTLATGNKLSQSNFMQGQPESELTEEQRQRARERDEKMHTGIAAGAGRMAGLGLNYAMMRGIANPALDKATDAIMNGTKVGQAIKSSSVLGQIGQTVGKEAAQDIGRGLVKETLSDATIGFGQNALLNYGEGLRGEDFWKQQAKDTALNFLIGGAIEGAGIAGQMRREIKDVVNDNPTRMLNPNVSKEDYLADLWQRMNARMGTYNDADRSLKLRDASYNKIDDLLEEYNKVVDMSPRQFRNYKNGRDINYYNASRGKSVKNAYEGGLDEKGINVTTHTLKADLIKEAERRGINIPEKVTVQELRQLLNDNPAPARAKFGEGRPKNRPEATTGTVEEAATIKAEPTTTKAETPEQGVKASSDETITVNTDTTPEESVIADIAKSQEEMDKVFKAIESGDNAKARAMMDEIRGKMDELDERIKGFETEKVAETKSKKGKTKVEATEEVKAEKSAKGKNNKNKGTTAEENKTKVKEPIEEDGGYKVGDKVIHQNFGKGEVIGFEEHNVNKEKFRKAVIRFEDGTEHSLPHTTATENGYLKHADADTDVVAKAEKEAVAETPAETLAKKEPTAKAETPKKTKAKSTRNPKSDQLPKADREKTPAEKALEERAEKEAQSISEQKVEPTSEKKSLPTEKEVKEATNPETTSRNAVNKLTNAQLKSMCEDYKIEVTPTGKKGQPLHSDYVDAVSKHFDKAESEEALNTAIAKAKETPAPKTADTKKNIPSKEIENPDDIKVGSYIVDDRYGVGKIVGFEENKYVGKIAKAEFSDDSFGIAVDKAGNHWKFYAGDDTPELGTMHKASDTTTVSGDAVSTAKAGGESTTTTSGEGTETFTSTNDIPNTPQRRPLPQLRKNKKTELPKSEKATAKNGKGKKPITSASSYQEVEARLGGSEKNKRLLEVEEFISKYKGKDTAKAIETYLRSDSVSPETKKIIMEMRENGEAFTKEVITNKSVIEEAERRISDDFNGTMAAFFNKAKSGEQFTSQDMADGFQIAKKLMENGEFRKAAEVNGELSSALSENARFLQSQRMWRSLTPEGRISSTLASLRKLEKSRGMKKGTIRIGEEGEKLLKAIYDAETNKDIAKANKEFATYVWNQVPRTFAEKANAWRYLAMLGNPKTHIRNVLGNALFMPARKISDAFATALEKAYSKKLTEFGGEATRRHAIINHFNPEDRALLKKAGENFKDDRDLLEAMSTKMFERQRAEGSSVFKTKYLDFLEKFNTKALNQEDVAFMGLNYKSAYAQYCKANGIKASDITEEIAKKASEYAQDQALKATYRDSNALADALNKMRKNLIPKKSDDSMMKVGKRAGGFLMDSTIPFVKTPLNILKRGTLEYSPVGIARGIGRIAGASDANSLLKGIEYLSNGLTGTGVLALGMFLANRGVVNGSLGEWGKDKAYSQMLGEQDYSVNVGDKTITLDWVAPMSMPFFVGVEAATAMADGINGTEILESMSNISDPIFEMSMLQGIENNFNMAFSDKKGLGTIAKNAGFNYLSQFVPTLAGQISRTRVRDRKTVVSTSTDPFVKTLEKNFGKILNKVPIAGDVINQDYVDLWGRTDSKSGTLAEAPLDYVESGIENFLSPAYISKRNETEVDKELKSLYNELGEEDKEKILPTFASNAFKQKLDGEEYTMTPAEFTQYKKTVGQARFKGLEKLFKTSEYKNASADEKRKMIESVYDDANNEGKKEYLSKVNKEFASAPNFYMLDEKQRDKYDDSINMSKENWAKAYTKLNDTNNEVYKKSGLNLSSTEKAVVLAENGVTSLEQAKTIYKNISDNAWENGYTAYKLGKTVEDVQKEAIARENMSESERSFDSNFRTRSEIRYLGTNNAPISKDVYNDYLKLMRKSDKANDDNGVIKQSEAERVIDYMGDALGLDDTQKAYLWHLSEGDDGWKKQPYGKWNG